LLKKGNAGCWLGGLSRRARENGLNQNSLTLMEELWMFQIPQGGMSFLTIRPLGKMTASIRRGPFPLVRLTTGNSQIKVPPTFSQYFSIIGVSCLLIDFYHYYS